MAKIIVIEDNPVNMKLSVFLLHSAGHEVLQATNAEVGLALIREERPNLVLMDLHLPGMDGLTAIRQIKEAPDLMHIKIIALTAHAMNGNEKDVLVAGCDGYVSKPFHYRELLAMVNTMLK